MKYLKQLNLGGIDIPFGTEIEFKGPELSNFFNKYKNLPMEYIIFHGFDYLNFDNWYLDRDDSVTKRDDYKLFGGELSSRIFWNKKSDWKEIILFCNALKESKAIVDETCSNHVSVGADFIKGNKELLMLFFKVMAVFENEITYFSCGEMLMPRNNIYKYAKPVAPVIIDNLKRLDGILETFDFDNLIKKMCSSRMGSEFLKNSAVNFDFYWPQSDIYGKKNRIEFRYPNGTISPVIIQNNINFFLKIVLGIIDNRFDIEYLDFIIKKYKEYTEDDYLNYINSENIKKLCEFICLDSNDRDNFGEQFDRVLKSKELRI